MQHYYEALDSAISTIKNRFDQPGYLMYCNLQSLLIKAACQQDFNVAFQKVTDFYTDDLNASSLSAQLAAFASHLVTHLTLLLLMIALNVYKVCLMGLSFTLAKFSSSQTFVSKASH